MTSKRRGFIDVDKISQQLSIEQVTDYFGIERECIKQCGKEIRLRCFLLCGKPHETNDRALAIQAEHPAKVWKCHDYDCPVKQGGNLVSLVSLAMGHSARPRGEDFKEVARTMQAILSGQLPDETPEARPPKSSHRANERSEQSEPKVNVPLVESENERVRGIAELYRKLTVDVSRISPAASRYIRRHDFLTEDVAADWQIGYLSKDTGGDRPGGTMRGKFVIAIKNGAGQIVGYAGRDPEFESKHKAWVEGGRQGKEPVKWTFPKDFHRSVELYGQERMSEESVGDKLRDIGLPIVEGPMDVINVWETLDTPCVGILSNHASSEQLKRIAALADEFAGGVATLLYDCNEQGENGMDTDTVKLSKLCRVQRGWARDMFGGQYTGKEPSDLTLEEWEDIKSHLTRGRCSQ